jgi:hypothetical protein
MQVGNRPSCLRMSLDDRGIENVRGRGEFRFVPFLSWVELILGSGVETYRSSVETFPGVGPCQSSVETFPGVAPCQS